MTAATEQERDAFGVLLPAFSCWLDGGGKIPDWLADPHSARNGSPPGRPSFAAQMDTAIRCSKVQEALFDHLPLRRLLRRRQWVAEWLGQHGWPTPEVLAGPFRLQDIIQHLQGLDSGVIKPVHATNAWGVVPFIRGSGITIRNLFDGQDYRFSALLELLHAPMQRYMFPNKWQIEELLRPPEGDGMPDDFKVYAFAGQVALILQIRRGRNGSLYKFYDADWIPVATGKHSDRIDMTLPPPRDPGAMLNLARQISGRIEIPFCRIDLFETGDGPKVGELTPEPGGYQQFDELADTYLGLHYEVATARLTLPMPEPSALTAV